MLKIVSSYAKPFLKFAQPKEHQLEYPNDFYNALFALHFNTIQQAY